MLQRVQNPLSGKAVQRPKQHKVKFAFCSIAKHPLKLCPVTCRAGFYIDVTVEDLPVLLFRKLVKLCELILVILLRRADTRIDCNFHGFLFRGLPPSLPFAAEDLAFLFDVRLPSSRIASEISFFLSTMMI